MYQVIARKYRPQSFTELVSQEHVKTTLDNAISQRRIAHGYIFSGQRGTGKTTVARIMARCLNCVNGPTATPCGECSSCLEIGAGNAVDVIEIDAASNRGINEMRELRESVRFRPARDRYKVFIIDEAHQITNEAFNALLKTLEEPPEWVVFILCTTESHKIPTTIASRCQQFTFRSVDFAELLARMRWICGQEGITADDEALAVLAQAGEGSVRDSLSALDQAIACCGTVLKADEVRGLLGLSALAALDQVVEAVERGDSQRMLEIVGELERSGANLQHFCRELSRHFRNLLVARITGANTRLIAASPREQEQMAAGAQRFSEEDLTRYLQITLDVFRDLQYSLQPRLHLELGLLKLVHAGRLTTIEEALAGLGGASGPQAPTQLPPKATIGGGSLNVGRAVSAAPAFAPPVFTAKDTAFTDEMPAWPTKDEFPRTKAAAAPSGGPPPSQPAPSLTQPAASAPVTVAPTSTPLAASSATAVSTAGPALADNPAEEMPPPPKPSPFDLDSARKSTEPAAGASTASAPLDTPTAAAIMPSGTAAREDAASHADVSLRERMHATLIEAGLTFTADAIESSNVTEHANEVEIVAPEELQLSLKEAELQKFLGVLGVQKRVKLRFEAGFVTTSVARPVNEDELTQRAMAHPMVKKFQDTFKDSHVRQVRNLKE